MNWQNLKRNQCPKCNKDFMLGLTTHPVFQPVDMSIEMERAAFPRVEPLETTDQVLVHPCGFKIRERRYSEIVNNQVTQDLQDTWDEDNENNARS